MSRKEPRKRASGAQSLAHDTLAAAGGRIDILANNAAYIPPALGLTDTAEEQIDQALDINIKALFERRDQRASARLANDDLSLGRRAHPGRRRCRRGGLADVATWRLSAGTILAEESDGCTWVALPGRFGLSLTLELSMAPRFGLEVSPALVVFGEMLMLPYAAMQDLIEEELRTNSALERLEAGDCVVCRGSWRTRCPICSAPAGGQIRQFADLPDKAVVESDTDALLLAVRIETRAVESPIVDYVIGSLDEHGFLDQSREQIAARLGVGEQSVTRVLDVIRRTGPPGIAATSVSECLILQLDAIGLKDPLLKAVISSHLPALAKGHFASIATELGVSAAAVRQVLAVIRRRLRPYPAFNGNAPAVTRVVVPDIIVRQHDELPGEFEVELVEPAMNRLRARRSVPRATSFLARLHDRWETLRRISQYVVEWQKNFLTEGAAALKPLTRSTVAAALAMHESTVSRAVADKYVVLPDRTMLPLSGFFGVSGGVDEQLRRLLESADGPISDQRLADLLRTAGYPIARRTVAKHRARLGFLSSAVR